MQPKTAPSPSHPFTHTQPGLGVTALAYDPTLAGALTPLAVSLERAVSGQWP